MPRVMKFRQRNAQLLQRIQKIEDAQEISFLKAAYCAGCDDDHNGDTVAALFVPSGVWATSMSGEHRGHDAAEHRGINNNFEVDLLTSGVSQCGSETSLLISSQFNSTTHFSNFKLLGA